MCQYNRPSASPFAPAGITAMSGTHEWRIAICKTKMTKGVFGIEHPLPASSYFHWEHHLFFNNFGFEQNIAIAHMDLECHGLTMVSFLNLSGIAL